MTEPTPTSRPSEDPVSPVSRTATFPAKPPSGAAAAAHAPLIDTSVPAINAQPVELDGLPTSPQEQATKRLERGGSRVLSPADEDVEAEFLGEGGKGAGQLGREVGSPVYPQFTFLCFEGGGMLTRVQKRAAMLASRSRDPGVIVDIPDEPTAEAVEAADSKDRRGIETSE